jgi:malate dehydrogenase
LISREGFLQGKALDIISTAAILGWDTTFTGVTNDYSKQQILMWL